MALTLSPCTTDTAVAGSPSTGINIAPLNFPVDFLIKQNLPGEVILTNKTAAIDRPERIRTAAAEVKDVYKGTGIDPALYATSRRGTSIVVDLDSTYSVKDSVDATFESLLPFHGHLVLRVPNNQLVTADVVAAFTKRLVALLFETGSVTSGRISALQHGSLLPSNL